jgi:hypothetical protein
MPIAPEDMPALIPIRIGCGGTSPKERIISLGGSAAQEYTLKNMMLTG